MPVRAPRVRLKYVSKRIGVGDDARSRWETLFETHTYSQTAACARGGRLGGGARAWRRHTCREAAVAVMGRGSKGAEMCASSGLVAAAEAFVRAELAGADGSHDFAHVERVRASAARLAADEGLGAADVAVAEVAALLHDVKGASQCRLPRSCLCSLERACEHPGTRIHPDGPVRSMCPAPHACVCTLSARTQTTSTAATLMRASLRRAPSSRTMALMQPSSTLSATSSSTWASRWGPAQHHVCAPPPIDDRALVGEPRAFVSLVAPRMLDRPHLHLSTHA